MLLSSFNLLLLKNVLLTPDTTLELFILSSIVITLSSISSSSSLILFDAGLRIFLLEKVSITLSLPID